MGMIQLDVVSNQNFHLLDHLHYGDAHIHLCITPSKQEFNFIVKGLSTRNI